MGSLFSFLNWAYRQTKNSTEKKYTAKSKYCFDYIEPGRFGVLMDENIAQTVFNKLYIRRKFDRNYFKPVQISGMIYQLWEVKSDVFIPEQNKK